MTINYANLDVSTQDFNVLFTRTNQVLTALRDSIVTVDTGDVSGNVAIDGSITTDSLYVTGGVYGGVFGNTQPLTVAVDLSVTGNTAATNLSVSGTMTYTAAAATSNTDTHFLTAAGNTVTKNDQTGTRESLDVYSKSDTDSQALINAIIF